jgi:hypothetical protein
MRQRKFASWETTKGTRLDLAFFAAAFVAVLACRTRDSLVLDILYSPSSSRASWRSG